MLIANMNSQANTLKFRDLQRRFDRAAAGFDEVDFVHRKIADGLMNRLDPMLINAKWILDVGGATGSASQCLCRRFRRSRVIVLDASYEMLRQAKRKQMWFSRASVVQANALALPVQTGCVDLVFANLLLPWINDIQAMFTEVMRVLRKGGLFIFSTLGKESLSELREAWKSVDNSAHVNHFSDMHNIGDGLVHAGLCDPVLDTDFLKVSYRDTASLFRDLTFVGGRNSISSRTKNLTGKDRFRNMERQLDNRFRDDLLELKLEIIYGHAWGGRSHQPAKEFRVEAAQIRRRQR
jgi:malonyl-CoA O-methyltransferase